MTEISMQWDGTTVGDAAIAPYDQEEVAVWAAAGILYDMTVQGVLYRNDTVTINGTTYDLSNLLAVTNPSGTTLRVASGAGIVAGWRYFNSGNEDLAGYAPSSGTNYFRVVLQLDWSTQTVRIALLADAGNSNGGASTGSAAPAVTQTWGTTWEISLATVTITSGPSVTITDTRRYIPEIQTSMIADDAVTTAKIDDDAVTTAKINDEAVTAAKIDNRTRQMFIPAVAAYNVTDGTVIAWDGDTDGPFSTPDSKISRVVGYGVFPKDYSGDGTIKVVCRPASDGDSYMTTVVNYSQLDGNGIDSDTAALAAVTFTALNTVGYLEKQTVTVTTAPSSYNGFKIYTERRANDVNDTIGDVLRIAGWILEYTADS